VKIVISSRVATAVAAFFVALSVSLALVILAPGGAAAKSSNADNQSNQACVRSTEKLQRNKDNVVGYYTTAFNDKNPTLAVQLYGGAEYIQHNPLAANGFPAFISFVTAFTTAFPDVHINIVRVIAECDLVVTHSVATGAVPVYGPNGFKLVDIFRLDENGKIVEHWDVGAAISSTSANGNPEV
jgi:predicted SnoaL-like aldol condensation-catalyzing enzyme